MALTRTQRDRLFGPMISYPSGLGVLSTNLRSVPTPWGNKIRVHHLIVEHTIATMAAAAERVPEFKPRRADAFYPRAIRNRPGTISMHSYGLANDWFLTPLPWGPFGGVWQPVELKTDLFRAWREVWREWGWSTYGHDLPHIEWAYGIPAERAPAPSPVVTLPPVSHPIRTFEETEMLCTRVTTDQPNGYGVGQARLTDPFGRPPLIVGVTVNGGVAGSTVGAHIEDNDVVVSVFGVTGPVDVWVTVA